jgi:hypothetical protein
MGFRRDSIGFENRPGLNEYLFHHGPVLDPHPNNTCGTARDTGQYMPNRTRPEVERRGDHVLYICRRKMHGEQQKKGTTGLLVAASADDDAELNY